MCVRIWTTASVTCEGHDGPAASQQRRHPNDIILLWNRSLRAREKRGGGQRMKLMKYTHETETCGGHRFNESDFLWARLLFIRWMNVWSSLWGGLHPQAHGPSELCWSQTPTKHFNSNPYSNYSIGHRPALPLIVCLHVWIAHFQAAAHHTRRGWQMANICISLLWIKISLCSCKCQNVSSVFFRKLPNTLFICCVLKNGAETRNRDGK